MQCLCGHSWVLLLPMMVLSWSGVVWGPLNPTVSLHSSWWHTKLWLKASNSLFFLMPLYRKDFTSPVKKRSFIGVIKNYSFNTKVSCYSKPAVLSTENWPCFHLSHIPLLMFSYLCYIYIKFTDKIYLSSCVFMCFMVQHICGTV